MAETKASPGLLRRGAAVPDLARRAGDFVITRAMGDRVFTLEEALYDEHGRAGLTGARLQGLTFAEEVHATFKALEESLALAGCTLADVIDCQVPLRDARDFHEFNRIYAGTSSPTGRSVRCFAPASYSTSASR